MICRACRFETLRTKVSEWHTVRFGRDVELSSIVAALLTEAATRALPPAWHGVYTLERAQAFIAERDQESTMLLATDISTGDPVGFLVVYEIPADGLPEALDLRLGYLVAESMWGRGFGTELVEGFVHWCRSQPSIRSITAGVAAENAASARVLVHNGFATVSGPGDGELVYELKLSR